MFEIIIIPIFLTNGQNYFYTLLLLQKIQSKINTLFKNVFKLKLLNNTIKIKSKFYLYNMFGLNRNYFVRFLADRSVGLEYRQELNNDFKNDMKEEAKQRHLKILDLKCEKHHNKIGDVRCENNKCKCYLRPQDLLNDLQLNLRLKMQEQKELYKPEEVKVLCDLVLKCGKDEKPTMEKYDDLLKCIEINCHECKNRLVNVEFTSSYVLKLQHKKKVSKYLSK